ncbi:phage integrase N-terminal SAM-like domain-containing protein [Ignavibacterium sp.]|uniref:phage integrase N-terminal SAM-like domain-containing protein n=1 Tax=Ignavibacterium sp. TaxID=2651167 RepID=UPI0021FCECA9|nr:phage integrase N-terminal SAM-like domain-containing protein [Ignavibacterium sp.]BDQ02653.1 MAG: hypothetical protein KatS3mg037_1228 [Ignavibacterium sp.]
MNGGKLNSASHLLTSEKQVTNPKLLDQVRIHLRVNHYSRKTEEAYISWIKRFILFNNKRHPNEMGKDIRAIQELLGHKSVRTTMVYTHVMNKFKGVRSPLDNILNSVQTMWNFKKKMFENIEFYKNRKEYNMQNRHAYYTEFWRVK